MNYRRQFALESNGPTRLELVWEGNMIDGARIFVDGVLAVTVTKSEFLRGTTLPLPDGRQLSLRLKRHGGFDIRHDGVVVPGCESDLKFTLGLVARWMFCVGGISLAFEIERLVRAPNRSAHWTLAAFEAAGDIVFLGLAVLTSRGARWALGIAVVMMLASVVMSWQLGRGLVATTSTLLFFAFLAQRFVTTSPQ